MPHTEFVHEGVPWETTQTCPHLPQLFTSFVVLTSHTTPSASQSAKPAAQLVIPHLPALQLGVPPAVGHTVPHALQLSVSDATEVSQPFRGLLSQSLKPALHVIVQAEATQPGVPLIAAQLFPHAVQLFASVLVFVSQPLVGSPSQSANGAVQVSTWHAPPVQTEVA
jgi:hypothetical protein